MDNLVENALNGNRRAVARLITTVERGEESEAYQQQAIAALQQLYPHTGNAHIIGITGSPGAGKSTLVNALAKQFRTQNHKVAIIAIDPSSPFTGGALLGDRIRMSDLYGDKGIFIRSMASRGKLGGLARTTPAVAQVLDASGYGIILIETVGAGQAEVEIASAAHTTLVVEAPGMGDDIQSIKAGILEIADILVVNKADRPGKLSTVKALRAMLQLGHGTRVNHHGQILGDGAAVADSTRSDAFWQPPIVETVAVESEGIVNLSDTINEHLTYLKQSGEWQQRERERIGRFIQQLLVERIIGRIETTIPAQQNSDLISAVVHRKLDPYTAASNLLQHVDWQSIQNEPILHQADE